MQQVQALVLMSQMPRFADDALLREKNAAYLDKKLAEIPGIMPYKLVEGGEKSAYHFYPFRFKKDQFKMKSRDSFMAALRAEGIPCMAGYGRQNKDGLIEEALNSRGYIRLYGEKRLNQWREQNVLPGNDQVAEEVVLLFQKMLLGTEKDMDDIVNAIAKIQSNAEQLN